jgi:uncharacterized protein (DUF4415 family)
MHNLIGAITARRATSLWERRAIAFMFCALSRLTMAFVSSALVKPTLARLDVMKKRKSLTDSKGEVRELSSTDLKGFRAAREALPASVKRKVGVRGPQKTPTKELIIRLSPEVVARFRATGESWQSRMDAALQEWLRKHKSAA